MMIRPIAYAPSAEVTTGHPREMRPCVVVASAGETGDLGSGNALFTAN